MTNEGAVEIYVDCAFKGSFSTGSREAPFRTIHSAVNLAEELTKTVPVKIVVAPGVYGQDEFGRV